MSRLAKKIDKCFSYFSFGFEGPKVHGEWIYGPTFAAKVIGLEGAEDLSVLSGLGIYKPADTAGTFEKLLDPKDLKDVAVETKKHSTYCSGRYVTPVLKDKGCEITFQMFDLAKALGVTQYKQSSMVVYGYRPDDEMVCLFAARYRTDRCTKTKEI